MLYNLKTWKINGEKNQRTFCKIMKIGLAL